MGGKGGIPRITLPTLIMTVHSQLCGPLGELVFIVCVQHVLGEIEGLT